MSVVSIRIPAPGAPELVELHAEQGTAVDEPDAAHRDAELSAEREDRLRAYPGRTRAPRVLRPRRRARAGRRRARGVAPIPEKSAASARQTASPPSDASWTSEQQGRGAREEAGSAPPPPRDRARRAARPTSPKRAWYSEPSSESGPPPASRIESPSRQPRGTSRTSSTSPTAPTTGVGWIARPLVSLYSDTLPETIGSPSASHAAAMPSIASASSQPISAFSGFPKLRQSVKPSGSAPVQARLRAASRTASAPPVNGSSDAIRPWPSRVTRKPAERRLQPEHGRVQARAADRAAADELVVAAVDELAAAQARRGEQLQERLGRRRSGDDLASGARRARRALHLVARALVGEQASGNLTHHVVPPAACGARRCR